MRVETLCLVAFLTVVWAGCLGGDDGGRGVGSSPDVDASTDAETASGEEPQPGNASGRDDADGTSASESAASLPPKPARTVVALVDTGINPYHEAFRRGADVRDPSDAFEGYPQNATRIDLSLEASSYREAVSNDSPQLTRIEEDELVSFEDTRIVGAISMGRPEPTGRYPILDEHGHGTATASMVTRAAANVDLVAVQIPHPAFSAEGIAWAANQSWIDVVSVSTGALANVPIEHLYEEGPFEEPAFLTHEASRDAARSGKLVVFAAGNWPTSSTTDGESGPPWVVSVGGASNASHGEAASASEHVDVLGPWNVYAAQPRSMDARDREVGTSFAAPTVAGTAASALQQVRRALNVTQRAPGGALVVDQEGSGAFADGRLNVTELRSALNRSAVYWGPGDFEPGAEVARDAAAPIGPAPWLQMGWGFVNGSRSDEIAGNLLGEEPLEAKPLPAQAHQQAVLAARQAQWSDP